MVPAGTYEKLVAETEQVAAINGLDTAAETLIVLVDAVDGAKNSVTKRRARNKIAAREVFQRFEFAWLFLTLDTNEISAIYVRPTVDLAIFSASRRLPSIFACLKRR